jgi:transcriptional regulator NrdR family protein
MKLPCSACGAPTEVLEVGLLKTEGIVRRRRKCKICGFRFSTVEMPVTLARKLMQRAKLMSAKTIPVGA